MKSGADAAPAGAYLIAGSSGTLGRAFRRALESRGARCVTPAEERFDITDPDSVRLAIDEFVSTCGGGTLLNAAAYTNVEGAESDAESAYLVNETGPRVLAEAAREAGLLLMHVSTDFVFDGEKDGPYAETDEPDPLSVYGASKLAGERAVEATGVDALVVRTAWLFGDGGFGFPAKVIERARSGGRVSVVTDEVGSPTYAADLADGIIGLVEAGCRGVYHLANSGSCSRYELASEALRLAGVEAEVEPVTAEAFPTKAHRPRNSVLDLGKAAEAGVTLPDWRDALARALASA